MKKLIAILLALVLMLAVVGCTKTDTGTPATEEPAAEEPAAEEPAAEEPAAEAETVALTVWVGDNYPAVTEQMIASFKEKYEAEKNVKFDITVGIESESTCKDTVLVDPEAAADVFTFADDQIIALVDAGALQPVTSIEYDVAAANSAGAVDAATVNGQLYAYPMSASNGYFMYYDSTFFTADDVKSLNAMCEKAAAAGKYVGMQAATDSGWYIYSFFAGAGLNMKINDDQQTNSCDWNSETGAAVAQGIIDLQATGGFLADTTANLASAAADGSVVAFVDGTWDSVAIQEAYGDGYAACKLPTFTAGGTEYQMSSFSGYKLIGVNPHSKNVGYAMLLAEWLTNEQNQVLRFEDQGDGPANLVAAQNEGVQANVALAALAAQSAYATAQRVGGNYWSPAATLGTILTSGNPDGTDLMELLDTAVAGITAPVS